MGKIQRYFVSLSVNQEIPDDENGHWVKYSDYQKELAAMTADRDRWRELAAVAAEKIKGSWPACGGSGKLKNG